MNITHTTLGHQVPAALATEVAALLGDADGSKTARFFAVFLQPLDAKTQALVDAHVAAYRAALQ